MVHETSFDPPEPQFIIDNRAAGTDPTVPFLASAYGTHHKPQKEKVAEVTRNMTQDPKQKITVFFTPHPRKRKNSKEENEEGSRENKEKRRGLMISRNEILF